MKPLRSGRRQEDPHPLSFRKAFWGDLGVVTLVAGLSQLWFASGRFIAAGDVTPFHRDSLVTEFGWLWSHQQTGAGSTTYDTVRALEVVVQSLTEGLGGDALIGQRVLYAVISVIGAVGGVMFSRRFGAGPWMSRLLGLLAVINPFVMVQLPNPLPLMTIGTMGILGALLLDAGRGSPRRVEFTIATLLVSYVALNPALLMLTIVWVAGLALGARFFSGQGATKRSMIFLITMTLPVVAVNLWWIVPMALAVIRPVGGTVAAIRNVSDWSWSHVDNSLLNVATLKAVWGWETPQYYPYAAAMDAYPIRLLRYALPLTALSAVFITRGSTRKTALFLLSTAIVIILAAKGLHEPLASVNLFLYENLPGFWLLREPMGKLGAPLVLIYLALAAIAVTAVEARTRRARSAIRIPALTVTGLLLAGALAAPIPMFTGEVIPVDRSPFPSAQVDFPEEWLQLADTINSSDRPGKTLVLPLAPFYQMTTSWGFHGADLTARQLIERPVIQVLPGGYFGETAGFESLVTEVQRRLENDETDGIPRLLEALGVSHVIVRADLITGVGGAEFADPVQLGATLTDVDGVAATAHYEVGDLFEFDGVNANVRLASETARVGETENGTAVASLNRSTIGTGDLEDSSLAFAWSTSSTGNQVDSSFGSATSLVVSSSPDFAVASLDDEGLTLTESTAISVDGTPITIGVNHRFEGGVLGVKSGGVSIPIGDDPRLVPIDDGEIEVGVGRRAQTNPFSGLEDCARVDDRTHDEAGLSLDRNTNNTITLTAIAHSACAWSRINNIDPYASYHITLEATETTGTSARTCVWLEGPNQCVSLQATPTQSGDTRFSGLVQPTPDTTDIKVFVYADGPDTGNPTTINYTKPTAQTVVWEIVSVADTFGKITTDIEVAYGDHRFSADPLLPHPSTESFSDLEDCARLDDRTRDEAGLTLDRGTDNTITLTAIAHSACAWSRINNIDPYASYHITLEATETTGTSARTCVWLEGPNQCVSLQATPTQSGDTRFSGLVQPTPDTTDIKVFVYADGPDTGNPTTITYTKPTAQLVIPTLVTIGQSDLDPETDLTAIGVQQTSPVSYRVDLPALDQVGVMVLTESFANGWAITDSRATHFTADGYANGWLLEPGPAKSLEIVYRPAERIRLIGLVPLVGLMAFLAGWAVYPMVRRRPARHRH